MQRMLKMSRGSYTGGNFKQNTWKKAKENLGPHLRSLYDKLAIWCQLIFYKIILCDHCLHDYHLYIWKMLTNREMVNFQKWDFFDFSLYFYYKLCHHRSTKMHIEYKFCFICSEQCKKIISSRKNCGLFGYVFKKIISYNTTPTFLEVGGVT